MKALHKLMTLCILANLCISMHAQMAKDGGVHPCPGGKYAHRFDLCLHQQELTRLANSVDRIIYMTMDGARHSMPNHPPTVISLEDNEQIEFFCSDPSKRFQITGFERIELYKGDTPQNADSTTVDPQTGAQKPGSSTTKGKSKKGAYESQYGSRVAPPQFSPFCKKFEEQVIGKTYKGKSVFSGPPREGTGKQWYKFIFKVNDCSTDPHICVCSGSPCTGCS